MSIPVLHEVVNNAVKAMEETNADIQNAKTTTTSASSSTPSQGTPGSPPSPSSAKTSFPTSTAGLTSSGNIPSLLSHILQGSASNLVQFTETLPPLDGVSKANGGSATTAPSTTPTHASTAATILPPHQSQLIPATGVEGKQIIHKETKEGENYVDITEYLNLPQVEASRRLGIPTSTLSKRWKEAVVNRKWPYRAVAKLDKEIMTLLHNIPQGPDAPPLPPEIEASLGVLLRKRQEELRTVVIRL